MDVRLDYTTSVGSVTQTITYPNWTGETLNELVLAVQPNLWTGGFTIKSLSIDDQPISNYTLDGQKLTIPLLQPLPPSRTLTIAMEYGLVLPRMQGYVNQEDVRPQIYGFTDRQTNLVDWYPFIVPYKPGEGWILHNPWYYGEHLVYDQADFDVTITFTDGTTPQIASSGAEVPGPTGNSRRFVLEAGRTFAFSISTVYKVAYQTIGNVTVYSYYFEVFDSPGQMMLQTTIAALQVFSERFGPYPHKTMTAVQGDFNDGMEYSGLYFISRSYFDLYTRDPSPKSYLVIISAHETAHQWWFDGVADDQALEPWLDEALCTYSERLYYERVYPDLVSWWWSYRYFEFEKPGYVDTTIYDNTGLREYWDKVYFTGARFLEDLRTKIGDDTFNAFLKDYYAQYAGKRATSADFFRVLREHTNADLSELMMKYFKNTY
jgi:aminopeptidase N